MLEIIYDANLITLPIREGFTFFGIPRGDNCEGVIEDFSVTRHLASGDVVVRGPRIGSFCQDEKRGSRTPRVEGHLAFIVPVNAGSTPYIEKLMRCDGLWVCGKFFETRRTCITKPKKTRHCHNFTIPPNHFYFSGEYVPC